MLGAYPAMPSRIGALTTNPIVPMQLIGNKKANGRKSMEQVAKDRIRKVYLND